MARRALVLGGGMIGSAMAMDLAADPAFSVTLADARPETLARVAARARVTTQVADLADADAVSGLAAAHDVVLGALPSALGLRALRAVIEAGRPCVDISFMAEDARQLDALARERGVTVVVDCGVAPGLSHMMVGFAAARLDACHRVAIYVGGLPAARGGAFEYKAGFAPQDVIEEYLRPARCVEDGRAVVKEALSEVEPLEVPGVGTLEAFLTDGLRSLVHTVHAREMKEKTLRYPGHLALMKAFRDGGFFSREPLRVGEAVVRPLEVTAALLFPRWTFAEGEADLTVMRVVVEGRRAGREVRHQWDLLDRYDPATGLRSMSRTTAFTATAVARLVAEGAFRRPGVHPPETLGAQEGLLDRVLATLAARGVRCTPAVPPEPV